MSAKVNVSVSGTTESVHASQPPAGNEFNKITQVFFKGGWGGGLPGKASWEIDGPSQLFFSPRDKVMSLQDGLSTQRRVSYLSPETYLMNQNTLSQRGLVIYIRTWNKRDVLFIF